MRYILVICCLVISLTLIKAEHKLDDETSEITKLDVIKLGEEEDINNDDHSDSQSKRDSGYSYTRPNRNSLSNRNRFHARPSGFKGKVVTRHPTQVSRPFNTYGPPNHQSSPVTKPSNLGQQHRDKLHYFSNANDHSNGFYNQKVPSPIRHYEFVEPSPIASQNNEPFGINTANYLPPRNQKLPAYSLPATNLQQEIQNTQHSGQIQSVDIRNQNIIQPPVNQISDAALFLAQNAQAIQQLYGSPASNQDFAPQSEEFPDQSNQIQNPNAQFQAFETTSPNPHAFQLPSYASGTLDNQETLEHIQSLEKDRLIIQLQQALATQSQSQNAEFVGRYAQNHGATTQDQDLLASTATQFPPSNKPNKFYGIPTQHNAGVFDQSVFLPGTTVSFGYRPTTTTPASTTTSTTTTGVSSLQPEQGTKGDGTLQVGTSLPAPNQPGSSVASIGGIPVYGGFVPTLIAGTNILTNVPAYGTGIFSPNAVTSSGSTPTHFGIPLPTDGGKKPSEGSPSTPSSTVPTSSQPGLQPGTTVHVPQQPLPQHPVTPLRPIGTPVHPISPLQPAGTPVHPVTSLHPAQTPAHPTYGVQPSVINPLLYKPIKAIYPVYYYPNVAYQLQKPGLSTYPWSYAPAYAQVKPTQAWK